MKAFWLAMATLCMSLICHGQSYVLADKFISSGVGLSLTVPVSYGPAAGMLYLRLEFTPLAGSSLTQCGVSVDSGDPSSWVIGGAISSQDCRNAGAVSAGPVTGNSIRISAGASGTGIVRIRLLGGLQPSAAGGGPQTGPDLLATGGVAVTTFAGECATIVGLNGLTLSPSAVPILQTLDATSGVVHDIICRTNTGAIVFPMSLGYSFGTMQNSANRNLEVAGNFGTGTGRNGIVMTNTSLTSRGNIIQWRSCDAAGVFGCGTDFTWIEDLAETGDEDITWVGGNSIRNLYYTGNCTVGCPVQFGPLTGVVGTKQFLLSDGARDAVINPEFGLVGGHIAHGTLANNSDNWDTKVCSGGTATVTFATPMSNATYQVFLTDQTTSGGAKAGTKTANSFIITCVGASDSVDYLVMGHPY